MLNTPVLFLIYRRPSTTQKVFNAIREAKPQRLFVAANGPNPEKESDYGKCQETRNILKQIDWDCELSLLFREEHLTVGLSISSSITWFFDHVEEGIILEDDCLPDQSFFNFCEIMLKRYRFDNRVMHISGVNFNLNSKYKKYNYYFSSIVYVWGWATWKRSWSKYDFYLSDFRYNEASEIINKYFSDPIVQSYWLNIFMQCKNGLINTWDYQWHYCVLKNQSFSINPKINLISNIGFGNDATHTNISDLWYSNFPTKKFIKTKIYTDIKINQIIDNYHLNKVYGISFKKKWYQKFYIKNKIKRVLIFLNHQTKTLI